MRATRLMAAVIGVGVAPIMIAACGNSAEEPATTPGHHVQHGNNAPATPGGGYWDDNGQPVNGGPVGADGSTGNGVTQEYCARNEDPACPVGTYVGPNAIPNPNGDNGYVPCEGTICTNPNHGAGDEPDSQQPADGG